MVNSQVSKKLTPKVSSCFSTTKGMDCEEITHDKANLTSSGHSSCLETFDTNRKYYFRLSLPVSSTFNSGLSGYHQKVGNKILGGVP